MIISQIDQHVLKKKGASDEAKVFFMKMIGDNYRYVAEMSRGERNNKVKDEARKIYEEASIIQLQPCNPSKLSLSLNIAVFYYEVLGDQNQAI